MSKIKMKEERKFAVLGCGGGGVTMTAVMAKNGLKVNLCEPLPQFVNSIKPFMERGGIEGKSLVPEDLTGFYEPNLITDNVKEAIEGVDVVMITARAYGHGPILRAMMPHLESGQIVLNWTSYFFCLRYFEMLKENGLGDVVLAEASILPYFTKLIEPTVINLRAVKSKLWLAAMPNTNTKKVLDIVKEAYPITEAAANVLDTSLNNGNLYSHICPALLNAREWEETEGKVENYGRGTGPVVRKLAAAMREEKNGICETFGLGTSLRTSYPAIYREKGSHSSWCPERSLSDYPALQEDIPYGMVPISQLGDLFGIPTPLSDASIDIFGVLCDVDFWNKNRWGGDSANLENIGLAGLTAKQMLDYVNTGEK